MRGNTASQKTSTTTPVRMSLSSRRGACSPKSKANSKAASTRSSLLHPQRYCMPGVRQWYYLCSSVTDSTNRRRETLAAIPRVTLEVAREVERVGARRAGADRNDDRLETVDRCKARAHLGDQLVLRHKQTIPADVLRQAVR